MYSLRTVYYSGMTFLVFITIRILGDEYQLCSTSLWKAVRPVVILSVLETNTPLSAMFLVILNPSSF